MLSSAGVEPGMLGAGAFRRRPGMHHQGGWQAAESRRHRAKPYGAPTAGPGACQGGDRRECGRTNFNLYLQLHSQWCIDGDPTSGNAVSVSRRASHRGHKAMTKLKFKPRGMVRPDSIFHLCQEIDGEWYAIITARSDGKGA